MFYHGVGIVVSNKHLQKHEYTSGLRYAFNLGKDFASYFKRGIWEDCQRRSSLP